MSPSLNGSKVLVTRPKQQAEQLCRLIEASGGTAIRFPTLEVSLSKDLNSHALLELFSDASHIIFISRNAVQFAYKICGNLAVNLREKYVIAVGDGTSQELTGHAVFPVISPGPFASSEALLDMQELDAKNIRGCNILIVQGGAGREFLQEGLVARGARVQNANVYQRSEPVVPQEKVDSIWHQDCPNVIVATSHQGLLNLIKMTAEQDRAIMFSTKLVVISARLGESARTEGFVNPAYVATEQSDQGLLQAIRQTVERLT